MIRYFTLSENPEYRLADITHFNNSCFPIRGNHDEYDRYRFVDNPFAGEKIDFIYGVSKGANYVAQMLTMPMPLAYNNQIIPAYWGQDYFVLENYRGGGIGKKLSDFYLKKDYYIAVGFSEKSAVIHQKMGAKKMGYLGFYQKWASPFHQLRFVLQRGFKIKPKKITSYTFPDEINQFKRIKDVKNWENPNINWNKNVIESLRNKDYMQWRFFYQPDRYFVYQKQNSGEKNAPYFVAKPFFYKGVNWLKVVDYRYSNQNPEDFSDILKASENLRKKLHLFGIIISSTQKISHDLLMKNKFKKYRNEVVLTTYPFPYEETDALHNQFIISFADSDMDMHTNLGKFNYGEDY